MPRYQTPLTTSATIKASSSFCKAASSTTTSSTTTSKSSSTFSLTETSAGYYEDISDDDFDYEDIDDEDEHNSNLTEKQSFVRVYMDGGKKTKKKI